MRGPERAVPDDRQEAPRVAPRCPACGAEDVEVISLFGQQAITLQYRCRRCRTPFEAIKYEGDDPDQALP